MKIGILQCDEVRQSMREEFDDYPDMFCALLNEADSTLEFAIYRLIDGQFPTDLSECDAYLITGSRTGVYDECDWIPPAEGLVRSLIEAKIPVVGICFGHQLIAQAMGGRVVKSDKGWGQGLHSWEISKTPWWMGEDSAGSFSMLVSHQDQVTELPAGADLIASSDFCSIAVFQLGEYALGFQGHPEFSKDYSRAIMDLRREMIGEQIYCDGLASLSNDPDAQVVARWILRFMGGSRRQE